MRQKNRRRSLLTLYHHKHNDENGNENINLNNNSRQRAYYNHLLHSDKRTYITNASTNGNTYFYRLRTRITKLVNSRRLGPQKLTHTSIPLLVSGFGLLMVLAVMICPLTPTSGIGEAYATDTEPGISTHDNTMRVSLTMADPDQTTLSNANSQPGAVNYISSGFKVNASNVDGYNVYVQTAPGSTNTLSNGKLSIDFVKEDTPITNFADNTWGYNVDSTGAKPENLIYNPIPASNTTALNPAYSSSSTTEERDFTLNFAAKFAKDAPAGHYSTDVILSVAAGAGEVIANTMQDFAKNNLCSNLSDEIQLIDDRSHSKLAEKTYWTAKMPDGKCWMAQNLDLALTSSTVLSAQDSDVQSDWSVNTLGSSYVDPGEYIYGDANTTNWPITSNISSNAVFKAVEGDWKPLDSPQNSLFISSTYNAATKKYDAHYLVGNYYNYATATAGKSGEHGNSICPKGWRLPTQSEYNTLINSLNSNTIRQAPYYFIPAGCYDNNKYLNVGNNGTYWSSTQGIALLFHSGGQGTSNLSVSYGYQVRCLTE